MSSEASKSWQGFETWFARQKLGLLWDPLNEMARIHRALLYKLSGTVICFCQEFKIALDHASGWDVP